MKRTLFLLALLSTAAHAEDNPFLPPVKMLAPEPMVGEPNNPMAAMAGGLPIVNSVAQRKKNDLVGARMVAIIGQEEVWFKPEQGLYVRYPVDGVSIITLEAPKPQDDIQQIKQALAQDPSKPTTIKGAEGKSW